jgi:DNA invertase Pin-like site-specific DNA recombinase
MIMNNKKYIAYYRVSTKKQGRSGLGLEAQMMTINQYVKSGNIVAEYIENESGRNNSRVKLDEAIEHCKKEGCILLIAKLNRLSRNVFFIFKLRDSGIEFECCDMPVINTLTVGINATIAQYDAEVISANTKDAMAAAKRRGTKIGRANSKYGKNQSKADKIEAETNRIEAIRRSGNEKARKNKNLSDAYRFANYLKNEGKKPKEIAETLNNEGHKTSRGGSYSITQVTRLFKQFSSTPAEFF